jgi:hypothetical protein
MKYLHFSENEPWGTIKVPWVIKSYNNPVINTP